MAHFIPVTTRDQAVKRLHEIAEAGTPGELTTQMAEILGINFDQFLRFAQKDFDDQLHIIRELSKIFKDIERTKDFGHSSQ